jgi:hypothetical protein
LSAYAENAIATSTQRFTARNIVTPAGGTYERRPGQINISCKEVEVSNSKSSDGSTVGAVAGGISGAILGTKIVLGLAVPTGGATIYAAPQIIGCCALAGAYAGSGNAKSTIFPGMAAGGTLADWIGKIAGS